MSPSDGRAVVVVSRFNQAVTRKLLDGALGALERSGWPAHRVDVIWVPGAFELPLAVDRALATGRYRLGVALGAVIRGETPHFEYVASAAVHGLLDRIDGLTASVPAVALLMQVLPATMSA